eukprot:gene3160-7770_t
MPAAAQCTDPTGVLRQRRRRLRLAGNTTPGHELRQAGRKRARSASSGFAANGQTLKRRMLDDRARREARTARAGWDSGSVAPDPFKGNTLRDCVDGDGMWYQGAYFHWRKALPDHVQRTEDATDWCTHLDGVPRSKIRNSDEHRGPKLPP